MILWKVLHASPILLNWSVKVMPWKWNFIRDLPIVLLCFTPPITLKKSDNLYTFYSSERCGSGHIFPNFSRSFGQLLTNARKKCDISVWLHLICVYVLELQSWPDLRRTWPQTPRPVVHVAWGPHYLDLGVWVPGCGFLSKFFFLVPLFLVLFVNAL